ncbi:MAG: hypothetical protein AB7O62_01120 [Pirellulales bacterium]
MSDRFRTDIAYFMSLPGEPGVPVLPAGEYWISSDQARLWLDDGVISLVSPLDSENRTDVELSEEHEAWLEWMLAHDIQHVRLG